MVAQLPHAQTDLTAPAEQPGPDARDAFDALGELDAFDDPAGWPELRAVGAGLLARLAELRERDLAVPEELWQAAARFQPLLDGIDPEPGEGEELWELALSLPRLLIAALLVRDGVQHVEPRST